MIVRRAGDVIPEVVGPVLAKRPPGTRVEVPEAVPGVRRAARPGRGRGQSPLRQRRLPGAARAAARALGGPRRDGHRRSRRGARAPVRRRRPARGRGRRLRAHRRAARAARADRRPLGAAARRRRSKTSKQRPLCACSSVSASTTSGRPPRRRWPRASPTSTRSSATDRRRSPRSTGVGPTIAESIGVVLDRSQPRLDREARARPV